MNFYSVVDHALALLRQRGRVTYRALKRQFDLDDDVLADLTEELIYGQRVAVDEDGRVLVWTGDMPRVPEPHASLSPSGQQPTAHEDHPSQAATPPPIAQISDAERRQLTVMFCDLVDSTALSGQLDPEDLRDVVRAYQSVCTAVIQRFDGYIAQLLGDGLLIYFGYPHAHEDDAQRAVQTGLGLLHALGTLNARLEQEKGIRLAIRVGIHTGPVVVGEMGSSGHHEQLALGDTPNIASRLQGLAAPDTVLISETAHRLVEGYVTIDALGPQALKGVATPLLVYRVLGASGAQSRLDVATTRGLTPLVGREQESRLLLERWAQARQGDGQVVLLSGEAGIGKSRLVEVLREHVGRAGATWLTFRCSPYHTHSALYPVITQLHRVLQFRTEDTPAARLVKLERALHATGLLPAEAVPLVAAVLSVPLAERYAPPDWSPQKQRQKTHEALVRWLVTAADRQPVLAVWEDLHWADPSTLELLGLLQEQTPTAPLCLLLTCRPEFPPPWTPCSYLTLLTLSRLPRLQVEEMLMRITGGKALPAEVVRQIVAKTDGVPLFVEELTKMVLEAGWLQEREAEYVLTEPLPLLAIPATLQDALRARLDRLGEGKVVAQVGAVLGRTFTAELLRAVAPLDEAVLWRGLGQLVQTEVLSQRGGPPQATYTFKHALLQETAYQSLLKSTRQQVHQRTAQVVVEQFPDLVETQPEWLAHHYTEAGLAEEAVAYWHQAGEHSHTRSAYVEAVAHCTRGLEVLRTLPDTPTRVQQELALQLLLSEALIGAKGHGAPDREPVLARARELCRQAGDTARLFTVLVGLSEWYVNQGAFQTARALVAECLSLAQRQPDPMLRLQAHAQLAVSAYFLGELVPAHAHLEQAMALSLPHHSRTPQPLARVLRLGYAALTLWMLGYPEQALTRSQEMLTNVQEPSHAFSLARALYYAAWLHGLRREVHATQERAEASLALSTAQGFAPWIGPGTFWRGWALAAQGQYEAGIAQMHQGLAIKRATGSVSILSTYLGGLAEGYGGSGQAQEGLSLLAEALAHVGTTGERYWEAELHRLRGALLLQQARPDAHDAESCFQHALAVAHAQQAKSLELRAATSLARLWQRQDKRQKAYALLAPVYHWFTEGFDTADLQQAKALLEALS